MANEELDEKHSQSEEGSDEEARSEIGLMLPNTVEPPKPFPQYPPTPTPVHGSFRHHPPNFADYQYPSCSDSHHSLMEGPADEHNQQSPDRHKSDESFIPGRSSLQPHTSSHVYLPCGAHPHPSHIRPMREHPDNDRPVEGWGTPPNEGTIEGHHPHEHRGPPSSVSHSNYIGRETEPSWHQYPSHGPMGRTRDERDIEYDQNGNPCHYHDDGFEYDGGHSYTSGDGHYGWYQGDPHPGNHPTNYPNPGRGPARPQGNQNGPYGYPPPSSGNVGPPWNSGGFPPPPPENPPPPPPRVNRVSDGRQMGGNQQPRRLGQPPPPPPPMPENRGYGGPLPHERPKGSHQTLPPPPPVSSQYRSPQPSQVRHQDDGYRGGEPLQLTNYGPYPSYPVQHQDGYVNQGYVEGGRRSTPTQAGEMGQHVPQGVPRAVPNEYQLYSSGQSPPMQGYGGGEEHPQPMNVHPSNDEWRQPGGSNHRTGSWEGGYQSGSAGGHMRPLDSNQPDHMNGHGSHGHPHNCRPCAFFHDPKRPSCRDGDQCKFCHASHPSRERRSIRPLRH
eukprot:GHVN01082375.1.p1 GENE.GHVN01082375.1~~GHVN01082375.1.p1  ORF type:complete len:555 (+),score=53.28 GHVN01082375.1:993-2657(+)